MKIDKGPFEVLRALASGDEEQIREAQEFQRESFRAKIGCYPEELIPVKVLWDVPPEPGPEVTAVSISGSVYTRYPKQGSDTNDWWRLEPHSDGESWVDLISDAAWRGVPILDASP